MTALGQHSMVPPFYANRAKVAPCARTAREAPSLAYCSAHMHPQTHKPRFGFCQDTALGLWLFAVKLHIKATKGLMPHANLAGFIWLF